LYKLIIFVPKSHSEKVKESIFNAGAGQQGDYESCCFEVEGIGQFKPKNKARPFIGKLNEVEKVPEIRLEVLCESDKMKEIISALKLSHPYEEPAFDIIKLESFNE
tara:strand:- start:480 stop:797 length:318 start_codon:yes stop_codon:yes gene_type:complete